jgi:hypothetical protein
MLARLSRFPCLRHFQPRLPLRSLRHSPILHLFIPFPSTQVDPSGRDVDEPTGVGDRRCLEQPNIWHAVQHSAFIARSCITDTSLALHVINSEQSTSRPSNALSGPAASRCTATERGSNFWGAATARDLSTLLMGPRTACTGAAVTQTAGLCADVHTAHCQSFSLSNFYRLALVSCIVGNFIHEFITAVLCNFTSLIQTTVRPLPCVTLSRLLRSMKPNGLLVRSDLFSKIWNVTTFLYSPVPQPVRREFLWGNGCMLRSQKGNTLFQ